MPRVSDEKYSPRGARLGTLRSPIKSCLSVEGSFLVDKGSYLDLVVVPGERCLRSFAAMIFRLER